MTGSLPIIIYTGIPGRVYSLPAQFGLQGDYERICCDESGTRDVKLTSGMSIINRAKRMSDDMSKDILRYTILRGFSIS